MTRAQVAGRSLYTLEEHRGFAARLTRFWGGVVAAQDSLLADLVTGGRMLEIGCGYGALVAHLRRRGVAAVGIDTDALGLTAGCEILGPVPTVAADAEQAPFRDDAFDCVVFRDAWHHLDPSRALATARRLGRGHLVILDPNITPFLRLARRIIGHVDEEAPLPRTLAALARGGWMVERVLYRDVLALPLSGAYIGVELVPAVSMVQTALLRLDAALSWLLDAIGLARWVCWRYVVVAWAKDPAARPYAEGRRRADHPWSGARVESTPYRENREVNAGNG